MQIFRFAIVPHAIPVFPSMLEKLLPRNITFSREISFKASYGSEQLKSFLSIPYVF